MKYRHIVSVTGLGGLYQLMSTKSNGAFVKSLEDLGNKFISSRSHQVTPLESIEIYTTGDNIYLHEVLEKLKSVDAELSTVDFKNTNAYVALFSKAVPEYDVDRVYNSDIKKILKWYLLLKKNDLLDFTEYFQSNEAEAAEEEIAAEEAKPAKKTSTKKAAEKKEVTEEEATAEKPAKKAKAASKKAKTEDADATEEAKPAKKTSTKKAATKKKED